MVYFPPQQTQRQPVRSTPLIPPPFPLPYTGDAASCGSSTALFSQISRKLRNLPECRSFQKRAIGSGSWSNRKKYHSNRNFTKSPFFRWRRRLHFTPKNMNPSEANPLFSSTPPFTRKSAAEAASTPMRKTLRPQHKTTICTGKFSLYHFRRRQRQYFFLQAKLTAGNEEYSKDRHLKERDRRNCNQVAAASAVCCLPLPVTKAK